MDFTTGRVKLQYFSNKGRVQKVAADRRRLPPEDGGSRKRKV